MSDLIANGEQSVKRLVRHLRRAFASTDQYQSNMKLKLKALREKNHWTQDQVASRAGMSKSYYSEIEGGQKAANSRRLQKFAEVFNVAVFELIDDVSVDAELLEHLQIIQSLALEDRKAVIRHAIGLAGGKANPE